MFAPSKQSRSTHHGHVVGISTGFQQQPHTHQVFLLAGKCKSCFSILSLVKAPPRFRLSKYLCFCMHSLLHLMTAIIVQLHNTNKMQQKATKRTSCKGPQMVPACAGSHQRQMFTPSCEVYAFLHHIALSCIVYTGLHESTRRKRPVQQQSLQHSVHSPGQHVYKLKVHGTDDCEVSYIAQFCTVSSKKNEMAFN